MIRVADNCGLSRLDTVAVYSLRRLTRSDGAPFAAALDVYLDTIPPRIRTDTNEIAFWTDEYCRRFEDQLYIFAFYAADRVIGYAELAYFRDERVLVIDYLAISPSHRRNNVFFEFAEHIRRYLRAESLDIHYAVAEVAYDDDANPGPHAASLVRLLKLEGFRVAKAPYYQPRLSKENLESELPALLLISGGDESVRRLKTATYMQIVRTIYVKHYLRWTSMYGPATLAQNQAYINELLRRIEAALGHRTTIDLNGYAEVLAGSSTEVTVEAERNVATNAVIMALTLALSLATGTPPLGVSTALWIILGVGVAVALGVWPYPARRAWLWRHLRVSRRHK